MRYGYICERDRHYVEVKRSIHDEPEEVLCEYCSNPMRRVYEAPPAIWRCEGSHGARGAVGDYN